MGSKGRGQRTAEKGCVWACRMTLKKALKVTWEGFMQEGCGARGQTNKRTRSQGPRVKKEAADTVSPTMEG